MIRVNAPAVMPTRRPTLALAIVLLGALLARILVPQGMMLAPADGRLALVLCTGAGPMLADIDVAPDNEDDGGQPESPCAFVGLTTPAVAPDLAVASVSLPVAAVRIVAVQTAAVPGRGLVAPPPPSTGPPRLA